MTMRVSTWGQVSSGLVVSMLAACGGGGGGGYGSTTLSPTINFSQPAAAATINFGQATTVAWTSAYTTSCTASSSSAAAGAFTGTQMTSGSVTVVPTAAGSYTYTLSCTGAGGTKSTSATLTVTPNLLAALAPTGTILTVGSTVDPMNGDANPYGLTIAPATVGLITKGDLVVCNFSDSAGVEGNGSTIIGLHPGATPAAPYRIAQSAALNGCNALTMLPDDSISASAWSSNLNPLVSATGTVGAPFAADTFAQPWGEAFVAATGTQPAAIYVTNAPANKGVVAVGGTIDRISLDANNVQTSFTEIVTGLCSGGSPGSIFGPAGLTYDVSSDTLYVVDSSSASVYRHCRRVQRPEGRHRRRWPMQRDDARPRLPLSRALGDFGASHCTRRALRHADQRSSAEERRSGGRQRRHRCAGASNNHELADRSLPGVAGRLRGTAAAG